MNARSMVVAATAALVLAGCGGGAAQTLGTFFGSEPGQAAPQPTAAERQAARFKILNGENLCDTCEVTGGGAGNETACGDAKFGLVAQDTDGITGTDGKGRLNFTFDKDFHINGPVNYVNCLNITEGEKGDTWGTVEFGGNVQVEKGLSGDGYTFLVRATDYGEPNKLDHLWIDVKDASGASISGFPYECDTEDGNLQLHATRFAQIDR